MKEKKILFIVPSYGMGGTMSSLKAMLSLLDDKLSVDIFPLYRVGPNRELIPNATIVKESVWLSASIKESKGIKRVANLLLRFLKILFSKFNFDITPYYLKRGAKQLHFEKYDCIISYSEELTKYVSMLPAKKRIAWIHSVYSRYQKQIGGVDEYKYFRTYDNIICVSEYAREDFVSIHSSLSDKVSVIYNCCDIQRLNALSKAFLPPEYEEYNNFIIASIGRLDPVKQFSKIPQIASEIKHEVGTCFKWLIIGGSCGDGKEKERILANICEYRVEDVVQLIGAKSNPYPYIAGASILVHTSSSETFGIVIQEALALGVPAVINNFEAAKELVKDNYNGRIVPLSYIPRAIIQMINDKQYMRQLKNNAIASILMTNVAHLEAPKKLLELV